MFNRRDILKLFGLSALVPAIKQPDELEQVTKDGAVKLSQQLIDDNVTKGNGFDCPPYPEYYDINTGKDLFGTLRLKFFPGDNCWWSKNLPMRIKHNDPVSMYRLRMHFEVKEGVPTQIISIHHISGEDFLQTGK